MHVILHLSRNMKLTCKTMSEIEVTFMIIHVKITCTSWLRFVIVAPLDFSLTFLGESVKNSMFP